MKFDPTATDAFDRTAAFFLSVARSRGVGALDTALRTNAVTPKDRPALRAARLVAIRGGGRDLRMRVDMERTAFAHAPCFPGCPCPPTP